MFSSKPIVISGLSAVVFHAREEWDKTTTLENPFKKDQEWYKNTTIRTPNPDGSVTIEYRESKDPNIRPATREEKNAYRRAEDEFVSKRVLWNCGWTEYEKFCKLHDLPIDALGCESPDGQCVMWCPEFGECNGR